MMVRRRRLWRWVVAGAGVSVWALLFYRAYTGLAIPSFGPADQASLAFQQLFLRFAAYLVAGVGAWIGLARATKRRTNRWNSRNRDSHKPTSRRGTRPAGFHSAHPE